MVEGMFINIEGAVVAIVKEYMSEDKELIKK